MDQEINYSIIIPHKNIPNLLQQCLDSIPRRHDIQIIVVDDNSDSNKVDFEHFPGLQDPYIEVIFTKEGKGAGYARNLGMAKAKGKWLVFADADDFFTNNAFEVFDKFNETNNDIIIFTNEISSDELIFNDPSLISIRKFFQKQTDDIIQYNNTKNKKILLSFYCAPWAKMFFREFVIMNSLRFEETMVMNDAYFYIAVILKARIIAAIQESVYIYTIRNDSLVRTFDKEKDLERLKQRIKINKLLIKNGYYHFSTSYILFLRMLYKRYGLKILLKAIIILYTSKHILDSICLHLFKLLLKKIMKLFKRP